MWNNFLHPDPAEDSVSKDRSLTKISGCISVAKKNPMRRAVGTTRLRLGERIRKLCDGVPSTADADARTVDELSRVPRSLRLLVVHSGVSLGLL